MPSTCLRTDTNEYICSYNYSYNEFNDLKKESKKDPELLKCIICETRMIPCRNKSFGAQWFRHHSDNIDNGKCPSRGEDGLHNYIESYVYQCLCNDYNAQLKVTLPFKDTNRKPDVYVVIGDRKVSVEVQLTTLDDITYIERTEEYQEAGIDEVLWIGLIPNRSLSENHKYIHLCDKIKQAFTRQELNEWAKDGDEDTLYAQVLTPSLKYQDSNTFFNKDSDDVDYEDDLRISYYYRFTTLKLFLKNFIDKIWSWQTCIFDIDPHWCNDNKCRELEDSYQKFQKEKKDFEELQRKLAEAEEKRRKQEEEERIKREEEAQRKREEERLAHEAEERRIEAERKIKENKERRRREAEQKKKEEEERQRREEQQKIDDERRRKEAEDRRKEEEQRKKEEEEDRRKVEEERQKQKEKEERLERIRREEEAAWQKKIAEEKQRRKEETSDLRKDIHYLFELFNGTVSYFDVKDTLTKQQEALTQRSEVDLFFLLREYRWPLEEDDLMIPKMMVTAWDHVRKLGHPVSMESFLRWVEEENGNALKAVGLTR